MAEASSTSETSLITYETVETNTNFLQEKMAFFDTRLYRTLAIFESSNKQALVNTFYPHYDYGSYAMDYYESPTAIQSAIESSPGATPEDKKALEDRKKFVEDFNKTYETQFLSARSFIHPYALVKLAGAYGNPSVVKKSLTYDRYDARKYYEVDGDDSFSGNYSKAPTTTSLIRFGKESDRGKTPYSFQDFVFCKWWNRIENNRMITLRRYAMPVTDNIEFADYDLEKNTTDNEGTFEDASGAKFKGSNSLSPFTPLATAVTYFGEDTGNKLSDILSFSAGYKWAELSTGDGKDPISISASQNDAGSNLMNGNGGGILGAVSSGLGVIAKTMGFLGEISNGQTINLEGATGIPPDPYKNGPYENRILGPINVITKTLRRDRGLEFTQDGLNITFEYVARPIAGINNKAVILDLLANMLVLCYSSGTWFGGMWRFRAETNPAIYPFKYGDTMNRLYKGRIFGKDGAIESLTENVFADGGNTLSTVLPDALSMVSNIFSGAVDAIKSFFSRNNTSAADSSLTPEQQRSRAKAKFDAAFETRTMSAIQKVIAAKALKGTTVPFIQNQRALLTGEPVGDWHLTIGNPFNPIAMIGNLVVKDLTVTFDDELGPDDFPIGFKAVVKLDHGLGRDRDAIESMFNRGYGRIYTLSDKFRSSADRETKVDDYTGNIRNAQEGRQIYEETRNTYYGGGSAFIAKSQESELSNKGTTKYYGDTQRLNSLKPTSSTNVSQTIPNYFVNPWMMGYTM